MKTETVRQGDGFLRNYLSIFGVCVVGAMVSGLIGENRYFQRIILLVFLWAACTSGFNIISGYGGQVVFGYMMFVGAGAYTTVLLFKFLGVSPWIGIGAGVVAACIIALIIGLPTLRLRSHYFAVATIAFPLIMAPILNHLGLEEVTIPFGGRDFGLMQFTDIRYYVAIAIVLLAITLLIVRKIERSRFGFALKALKQNESAAEGTGVDVYRTKLIAFVLSAALGAVMGSVYAFSSLFVLTTHAVFGLFIIVRILSINIVGGLGTLWGPVIAAAILVPLGEFLNAEFGARAPGVQDIVYGAALIATIIYMPAGIWGKISELLQRQSGKLTVSRKGSFGGAWNLGEGSNSGEMESLGAGKTREDSQSGGDDPILKLEGVTKSFGGVTAVKEVNIEVPEGRIFGIIGPNGAGKTTLFNVINGYLRPDKGRVIFLGADVSRLKPHDLCRLGVARTFQVAQIFNKMTVLENIMIGVFAKHGKALDAYEIARNTAERMNITSRLDDRAVGLSIWETKILELSRALATEPKLLLVDEPMAGLNLEETDKIGQVLKDISKTGITVVVIEHVVQSLVKIADLMTGLDEGRKVAEGTPAEVISNPHIIEAYLGAKWRERYARSQ
jgi:ABC-type branched-subunit amino acid transport system ATPase component/ABC-type branched-subunit amino acid transport system permease subunit